MTLDATAADAGPAPIGHNMPPEATPFEAHTRNVDDLYEEAKGWLDGGQVESQAQADDVAKLLDMLRQAAKAADAARAAEKKPHDDAAKAVQSKWKPLLDRMDRAISAAKSALQPWLVKLDQEKRAEAERLAREAEAARRAAQAAHQTADPSNLEAREAAEAQLDEANMATAAAKRADREKAQAKGGARAVGLRTVYRAEVTDIGAALEHYVMDEPQEFLELIQRLADRDVRAGRRVIPGVTVREDQVAV